jgi:energy-coupling factor transport system ATP-binding protein
MAARPTLSVTLSVEALSYRYRGREEWALRDVSFNAAPGDLLLIAGASGCGKTTLIRCLNGLIPRSYKGGELAGTIRMVEPAVSLPSGTTKQAASLSHSLGTVLQDPERQIVGSCVANEVAFGLENMAVPRPEMQRRVTEVLAHLDISELAERETASLSGGEKQKVAIAGALVMEPSVLLLDEPLANLDPASAREALLLFRRLADEGHILLIVEHRVEDVLTIHPNAALYLSAGHQQYFGAIEDFLDVADPREVKLPARLAIAKLRTTGIQVFECSGVQEKSAPGRTAQVVQHPNTRTPEHLNTPPLVEFDHVTFAYDEGASVLRDITAAIRDGDVIAVLGPNGAGKSTLLKHAIGLIKPRAGRVLVNGKDTRETTTAELARTVGYVFQSPGHMLFANSVREELAFGPRNLGLTEGRIAANVTTALASVDLAGYEERPPLALSFGQQKRVGIAAILTMEPHILVMDEPTAGQDFHHYGEFMQVILALAKLSAVVFITHDLDLAITHANRVWLIADGCLVADGRPEEALADDALLVKCRLHTTSLLELNRRLLPKVQRFLSLEAIAAGGHALVPGE